MSIDVNTLDQFLIETYGDDKSTMDYQKKRHLTLIEDFKLKFGEDNDVKLFSVPGRTEIGGNHTDHGHGRVLAASVNLDTIAAAAPNGKNEITIFSDGYEAEIAVNLDSLEKREDETGTSSALVRGISHALSDAGFSIVGFNAFVKSNILNGVGLSSSAAFEILIGMIFNELFNGNKIDVLTLAKAGQSAEKDYFGKPCGLMDQIACASGGIVAIDFKNYETPEIEKIDFNLDEHGYKLLIINTGGNHINLTEEYSAIPEEMLRVAQVLGKSVIRDVSRKEFFKGMSKIRADAGDRAALRALHFIEENKRVLLQKEALKNSDFKTFFGLVRASGNSSFKLLQNIVTNNKTDEQGIALALAFTEEFFASNNIDGACRVHGGGFAGSIQVYLPTEKVAEYKQFIEPVFGSGSVNEITIRPAGAASLSY
jgi:galactokinase